jgi:hypothetical protein
MKVEKKEDQSVGRMAIGFNFINKEGYSVSSFNYQ